MGNYAEETISFLKRYNYTVDDISWIGTDDFIIPISEFFDVARKTFYNPSFGRPETPGDIVIVMKDDSWFERFEYDGAEGWEYHIPHIKPIVTAHIKTRSFNYKDEGIDPYDWAPALNEYVVVKRS